MLLYPLSEKMKVFVILYYVRVKKVQKIKKVLSLVFNKKTIPIYVALIIVLVMLFQIITTVVLCGMIFPKGKLAESVVADHLIEGELSSEESKSWLKSVAEKESIKGESGSGLSALKIDSKNSSHSYIILCHPTISTPEDMADYAYHFYDIGFNVIIPYMMGCGENSAEHITFGVGETGNIISWINNIVKQDSESSIFLFGLGTGGSAVMSVCDEALPENVKGIIEDSGYDELKDVFKENIDVFYNKKSFPAIMIADIYAESEYGVNINDVCLRDEVHNSTVPILFIHGSEDKIVPVNHSNDMYEVCPAIGTDHLLISGATHCRSMHKNPEKYWKTVDEFIVGLMDV